MSKAVLDKFGQILMLQVRDEAVSDWKMIVDGRMKGERAERLRRLIETFSTEQQNKLLDLVPEIVDSVLHHLLWTCEQRDDVKLGVTAGDESIDDLKAVSDGLAGELYSRNGWITRFSKEHR